MLYIQGFFSSKNGVKNIIQQIFWNYNCEMFEGFCNRCERLLKFSITDKNINLIKSKLNFFVFFKLKF